MTDSRQSVVQRIARGCSRVILWVGAAVFLVGDKYLYEIRHVNFLLSVLVGIFGGVVLMLIGAVIKNRSLGNKIET